MPAPETGATLARSSIPVPAVSPSNNRSTTNTSFFLGEQIMAEPWLCVNKKLRPLRQPPPLPESKLTRFLPLAGSGRASTFHFPVQPQHEEPSVTDPRSPGTPGSCNPHKKALQRAARSRGEAWETLPDRGRSRACHGQTLEENRQTSSYSGRGITFICGDNKVHIKPIKDIKSISNSMVI